MKTAISWILLMTLTPSLSFAANQSVLSSQKHLISLADTSVLKRVVSHYNQNRDLNQDFYHFLKTTLSAEDYGFAEQSLKGHKTLPVATISGNHILFQGGLRNLTIEQQKDGKLLISSGSFHLLTTEKTAMSDLIQQLRHPKKDLVSQVMDLFIPEAQAFWFEAADAIASMGGVMRSFWNVVHDGVKDGFQDMTSKPNDKAKLAYLRSARDNLYSCQKTNNDWRDNWFQRSFKDREGTIRKIADHFDDRAKLNEASNLDYFNNENTSIEQQTQITLEQAKRDCTGQETKIAEGKPHFEIAPAGSNQKILLNTEEHEDLCKNLQERLSCLNLLKSTRTSYLNNYYAGANTASDKAATPPVTAVPDQTAVAAPEDVVASDVQAPTAVADTSAAAAK